MDNRRIIIILGIGFTFFIFLYTEIIGIQKSFSDDGETEIIIPTTNLKMKVWRGDTVYAIERFVEKWIKNNPEAIIYMIQSHSTIFGSRILYIWYRKGD